MLGCFIILKDYNRGMKKTRFLVAIPLITLLLGSCNLLVPKKKTSSSTNTTDPTTLIPDDDSSTDGSDDDTSSSGDLPDIDFDPGNYYGTITDSMKGEELLSALRAINKEAKTKNVGYGNMGTNPSGMYKYTDYDPDSTILYDENDQPYGTKIISFYSGKSTSSFNREHVWPNTHGGNLVENDIHMPRPTIPTENGSRGHSFYVEGIEPNKQNKGWDPAMESFGVESYRGDSARIIFYCMIASNQLTLTDDASRSSMTNNHEMGVISDMLSWNVRYPVLDREQRRNAGAQYLQGNRNPFIDHPEYACRIWGETNDATRKACGIS